MDQQIVILTPDQLQTLLKCFASDIISNYEIKLASHEFDDKVYNISATQKILKIGYRMINRLVASGDLKMTKHGKITGASIKKYLEGEPV